MLRHTLVLLALVLLALVLLAAGARAQGCPGQNDVFLKNDKLPDIPGQQTVSVIQGLCEGEAIGAVFDVSPVSSMVQVNNAVVGYVNVGGANGIQAEVNLQIFDGVTWNGGIPTLGPKVFDWNLATGSSIGVTSTGLNVQDISSHNVRVSSGTLVVVWQMLSNPLGGNCAAGYQTNFATDWDGTGLPCAPARKNLLFIQGQGWRDATTAMIGQIPICPFAYAGNWLIRACVEPAGLPASYCTAKINSQNCTPAVSWTGSPTAGGNDDFFVTADQIVNSKNGIFFWGFGPNSAPFFQGTLCVSQPVKRTGIQDSGGTAPPATDCTGTYAFHFSQAYMVQKGVGAGSHLYGQFWMRDPAHLDGTNVGLSDGLEWILLP